MKITNTKNITFNRITPVNFQNRKDLDVNLSKKIGYSVQQVEQALNSKRTEVYSKQEEQQIRDFFKKSLDDYNGENGIAIIPQSNGRYSVFSGKDYTDITNTQNHIAATGLKNKHKKKIQLNKKINKMIQQENRRNDLQGKDSEFSFEFSNATKMSRPKFDIFRIQNFKVTSSEILDGFTLNPNRKTSLDDKKESSRVVYGMIYDEKSLNLSV